MYAVRLPVTVFCEGGRSTACATGIQTDRTSDEGGVWEGDSGGRRCGRRWCHAASRWDALRGRPRARTWRARQRRPMAAPRTARRREASTAPPRATTRRAMGRPPARPRSVGGRQRQLGGGLQGGVDHVARRRRSATSRSSSARVLFERSAKPRGSAVGPKQRAAGDAGRRRPAGSPPGWGRVLRSTTTRVRGSSGSCRDDALP